MARRKPTPEDLTRRVSRSEEWYSFRKDNLFTQLRLAEVLGLSRRTVQMIEAGKITPHPNTLRLFEALQAKYKSNRKRVTVPLGGSEGIIE